MFEKFKTIMSPDNVLLVLRRVMYENIQEKGITNKLSGKIGIVFTVLVLLLIYIANGYSMEKLQRRQNSLEKEIEELRVRSVGVNAELMQMQKASSIMKRVRESGIPLKQSGAIPVKLYK